MYGAFFPGHLASLPQSFPRPPAPITQSSPRFPPSHANVHFNASSAMLDSRTSVVLLLSTHTVILCASLYNRNRRPGKFTPFSCSIDLVMYLYFTILFLSQSTKNGGCLPFFNIFSNFFAPFFNIFPKKYRFIYPIHRQLFCIRHEYLHISQHFHATTPPKTILPRGFQPTNHSNHPALKSNPITATKSTFSGYFI